MPAQNRSSSDNLEEEDDEPKVLELKDGQQEVEHEQQADEDEVVEAEVGGVDVDADVDDVDEDDDEDEEEEEEGDDEDDDDDEDDSNGSRSSKTGNNDDVPRKYLINKEVGKASEKMADSADLEPQVIMKRTNRFLTGTKKKQTEKKIASLVKRPSTAKPNKLSQLSKSVNCVAPRSAIPPDFIQENHKQQKLDEGKTRQILNVKMQNLSHDKSKAGLISGSSNINARKEDRKFYVRKGVTPFVSSAELDKRFQSSTRDTGLPQRNSSIMHLTGISSTMKKPKLTLTRPKEQEFETSHRVRSTKVKSSVEVKEDMVANMPKFKAQPINKKMCESKGCEGIFRFPKENYTVPQEFHFATEERSPLTNSISDLFDKLSLKSESRDNPIPRITRPNPFQLKTEKRGAEKEKKFVIGIWKKQLEEERLRVPKATPYPYTTDYLLVPPKPEPKQCTRPEPFQLESLVRHEEEMRRKMEERERLTQEEAQMRIFKAQPILREDPLPLPEKEIIPLTRVKEFPLHVDHRAVDRAEYDKKIKEKEMMYKRYREERESAKLMEEEKALKQLRRTLVPRARPVPNFANSFLPQSSKQTTKENSLKLRLLQLKQRTSASASNMR